MSEMLDRVARAIASANLKATIGIEPDRRVDERALARAAIEAMWDPSEQQLFRMSRVAPKQPLGTIRAIYRVGIDAALE